MKKAVLLIENVRGQLYLY